MIRVLLTDDHQLFRQGLRRLLESEHDIEVVGEASNGVEVQQLVQELRPDVILMDVSMALVDGIAATREVVRQWPDARVVVLSMHDQETHLFQALQAGAVGYVLKTAAAEELTAAVRAAAAGGAIIDPALTDRMLVEFRRMALKLSADDDHGQINDIEARLLRLIASGLSNKEIAARLSFAESTVKNRLSVLFQKVGVSDRTQAAIYAITHGFTPVEVIERQLELSSVAR
jgi:DNA-binding NarL/FixJ family response regulator